MPRLITDPVPAAAVDYYLIDIDGNVVTVEATLSADETEKRLEYDVTDVAMGSHTAKIAAGNAWGQSEFSDPFEFIKALPGVPSGIGLET